MPYTRHTLCDYMDMVRYRLVNQSHQEGPRISWIRVPISVNGSVQAYFAVMEAREFLDYYDEYSIRIAYLIFKIRRTLRKHFTFASEFFAYFFISAVHSVVTAYYYNTHLTHLLFLVSIN